MTIDYDTPSGEQRTLTNVEHVEYVGTAYLDMTEVVVLRIGTDELVTTGFRLSGTTGSDSS